jgi:3-hydroxyacyl-CoA dehydrogenase
VEEAALASGLSMGPFLTLDVHGLEDYLETAGFLRSRIGERFRAPEIAVKLLEMGVEGQHGKRGFYVHTDGRPWLDENLSPSEATQVHSPRYDEVIQERLLLSIIGEAVRIFGEGISLHPEIIDCALVSIGMFPAHLGGPLHHAALLGIPKLLRRFEKMYGTWGVQFEPPEFLSTSLGEKTFSSFAAGERV